MIINLIVIGSLLLGGLYFLLWLVRKDIRTKIEEPKYRFQDKLNQYERQQQNNESIMR